VTETTDCGDARTSLGVYVLDALDPEERAVVDAHLATCAGCRAELADIEDLPALLATVSAEDAVALGAAESGGPTAAIRRMSTHPATEATAPVTDLSTARKQSRRRGAVLSLAAAAAIAVAALGGAQVGSHLAQGLDQGPASGPWQTTQGQNSAGMQATVRFRSMGWGTQLAVKVTGIPAHIACEISAFGTDGSATPAGSWITDANEGKVWYPASAGLSGHVTRFVITIKGHPVTRIAIPA
jgi:anti-sigma factor RsiW